ncbi:unnamed protein product [Ambrosiozyma monospora]|uniref:Unnamed protein product n=1 Tax=Ambrosiozyma monospora TaxID=43982 RepID=A0A9W6SUU3_AMBMO|nr:unnamed protein product [Ambrosiozyma monospora]
MDSDEILDKRLKEYVEKALSSMSSEQQHQDIQAQTMGEPTTTTVIPQPGEFISKGGNNYFVIQGSPAPSAKWTFTHGLVLGQLSFILLAVIFTRFFIFSESIVTTTAGSSGNKSNKSQKKPLLRNKKSPKELTASINGTINNTTMMSAGNGLDGGEGTATKDEAILSSILEKTYYDVEKHHAESLDWFNVLLAQFICQIRQDALDNENIYHSLNEAFSGKTNTLDYLSDITIDEINIVTLSRWVSPPNY